MNVVPGPPSRPARGVTTWPAEGAPRGRLALLHGITSSRATWWRVGPALAAAGWDVTALDLAGHGEGPRLRAEQGDLSTLVDAVVPALPVGLTALVGHSLGAIVALSVAARHPDAARGLVLEDPPGTAGGDAAQVADGIEAGALAVRANRQGYWQYVRQANPVWADADVEGNVAALEAADTQAITRALRAGLTWDLPALVGAVRLPVLVVAARQTQGTHPAGGGSALVGPDREAVRRLVTDARFVELDGGHSLHREQPDRMVEIVSGFAASLVRSD
ncbi:MAG: alpha/beta fold hydrolase [Acidimicrobiales bacterium]